MINNKISIHPRNLAVRIESLKKWRIPESEKKQLLKFLNQLALGQVNVGKRISENRQLKYLDILKTPLEFFNKPSSNLNQKDVEAFEHALTSNILLSIKNKPFAASTKGDIRTMLKVYLRWHFGDTDKYRKICGWIDTAVPMKTPQYLSETEIEQLYSACQTAEQRFFISVLFDGGMRAEEFHNIRYEDIRLPSNNDNYIRITLKEEYSKTLGRVISLYWKHSLDAVRAYLREREQSGIRHNDPVFATGYDAMRQFLYRLGRKILNKSIGYHLFRHSSATYYASKLNRQQLCYRYGWRFSSSMPDVYISRAGMENSELDKKFGNTEIENMRSQLEAQLEKYKFLFEKAEEMLSRSNAQFKQQTVGNP